MRNLSFLFIVFICVSAKCYSLASDESSFKITENIERVEQFFALDRETLSTDDMIALANEVLKQRIYYSANIAAKVFILLAQTAINSGDINKALQFAQDGLAVVGAENELKIELLLQMSFAHYSEGRFRLVNGFAQQAAELSKTKELVRFHLIALSYTAMSNALLAKHQLAFEQLKQVEELLSNFEQFSEHIEVIEILALAHLYLQDYQVANTLYNKAIKLRFEADKMAGINRSYYYQALVYYEQNLLNDAYTGFYEAKQQALIGQLPIRVAYANLGLAKVLLKQNAINEAITLFNEAREVFELNGLTSPYLSTLIGLASAYQASSPSIDVAQYLQKAEQYLDQIDLSREQLALFEMLADMYHQQNNFQQALVYSKRYIEAYHQYYPPRSEFHAQWSSSLDDINNQQLAVNLAVQSDLRQSYFERYQLLNNVIYGLGVVLVVLFMMLVWVLFKLRHMRLNKAYEDIEKPSDYIASPSQSKKLYQDSFKMARRYQYTIAIGYLHIENWEELSFRFNRKTINEVKSIIATLINEVTDEFEQVGLLHDGEYILLSPYQHVETVEKKLKRLSHNLTTRFFANLGDFSVKISFAVNAPTIQDIDPYIFLSRLSESTRSEHLNFLQ